MVQNENLGAQAHVKYEKSTPVKFKVSYFIE